MKAQFALVRVQLGALQNQTKKRSRMTSYRHTPEMGTLTSKGDADIEKDCQDMLHAGVAWIMEEQERRKEEGLKPLIIKLSDLIGIFNFIEEPTNQVAKLKGVIHNTPDKQAQPTVCLTWF